jgi:NADH-quinone oxidoreductase subunit K
MIPIHWFLELGAVLFVIGSLGVILRRNALIMLMGVELQLNAANLTLVAFSRAHHDAHAQAFAFIVIAVAAAEAAVGLAILVTFFRIRGDIAVDDASVMKG